MPPHTTEGIAQSTCNVQLIALTRSKLHNDSTCDISVLLPPQSLVIQ